jgi:two-component system cell cycle sensor histidine kinase/response regulator CckA
MPTMDGLALARVLKRMSPDTAIIASSGQADEMREAKLKDAGVNAFLRKPYNTERLLTVLQTALAGRSGAPR